MTHKNFHFFLSLFTGSLIFSSNNLYFDYILACLGALVINNLSPVVFVHKTQLNDPGAVLKSMSHKVMPVWLQAFSSHSNDI